MNFSPLISWFSLTEDVLIQNLWGYQYVKIILSVKRWYTANGQHASGVCDVNRFLSVRKTEQ